MKQFSRSHYLYDVLCANADWCYDYDAIGDVSIRYTMDAYSVGVAESGRPIQAIRYYYAE